MNSREKGNGFSSQWKAVLVVVALHCITIIVILAALWPASRRDETRIFLDTVGRLEKSVSMELAFTDSVARLSRLARKSGYELAVDDIIRDHTTSMSTVKENLAVLKNIGKKRTGVGFLLGIAIIVALQGLALSLYLVRLHRSAAFTIDLMERRIDDAAAGRKREPTERGKVVELRELYEKLEQLIDRAGSSGLREAAAGKKRA